MVFAHIFGIPVEETALAFAPVIVLFLAGLRINGEHVHRKLRLRGQRGMRKTHV